MYTICNGQKLLCIFKMLEKNIYQKNSCDVKRFISRSVAMGSSFKADCFFIVWHTATHFVLCPSESIDEVR